MLLLLFSDIDHSSASTSSLKITDQSITASIAIQHSKVSKLNKDGKRWRKNLMRFNSWPSQNIQALHVRISSFKWDCAHVYMHIYLSQFNRLLPFTLYYSNRLECYLIYLFVCFLFQTQTTQAMATTITALNSILSLARSFSAIAFTIWFTWKLASSICSVFIAQ